MNEYGLSRTGLCLFAIRQCRQPPPLLRRHVGTSHRPLATVPHAIAGPPSSPEDVQRRSAGAARVCELLKPAFSSKTHNAVVRSIDMSARASESAPNMPKYRTSIQIPKAFQACSKRKVLDDEKYSKMPRAFNAMAHGRRYSCTCS